MFLIKRIFPFGIALMLFVVGCKKPTEIGANIFPDNIGSIADTTDVLTSTETYDSLFTDNQSLYRLGLVNDPIFGRTYADVYSQMLLSENNVDFGTGAVADSMVIQIRYNGFYGTSMDAYDISVYEIDDASFADGESYASKTFNYNPIPIGSKLGMVPDYVNLVPVGGDTLAPHLRINLDIAVANDIISQSGTANLADDSSFAAYFNGFLIAVDSSSTMTASLMGLNFNSIISKVIIYYQNAADDSLSYEFDISNNAIKSGHYVNNHAASFAQPYINTIAGNDSLVFGQPMEGLRVKVDIPILDTLKNVIINKAELVAYRITDVGGGLMDTFTRPSRILAEGITDFGEAVISADEAYSFVNLNYRIGGSPDSVFVNGNLVTEYRFNLTLQSQEIVNNGFSNNGIYLSPFPENTNPRKIVLAGGNHSKYKMRYYIKYTPM